jgi:hypothetical protein
MSKLAQLQIDLANVTRRIEQLLSSAGNTNKTLLFNTACEAHAITSQLCIEVDRLIAPSYVDDKHWEPGL